MKTTKPFGHLQAYTVWKASKYRVFLVCIFLNLDQNKLRTLQSVQTFHAVLSLHLKLRFFDSLILSIHLYSAESRTLVTIIKNHLNSSATSCYRVMLNIKRTGRIRNDRLLDICNIRIFADLLTECQLRTLGHWQRKEGS